MRSERLRRGVGATAAGVVLAATAACGNPVHLLTGGDPIDDYCAALNSHREQFADMMSDTTSPVALLDALPMFRDLAGKAPEDITDDWQTLVLALQGLQRALDQAGVPADRFAGGKVPSSLDRADKSAIAVAADQVSAPATVSAVGAIDQEARDVCKINLGL